MTQQPISAPHKKRLARTAIGRVTERADYRAVAATRRRWVTPSFILQAAPGDASISASVGFTASKKVGKAVQRSKARRRLKEAAARVFPHHAPQGWAFVLIARESATSHPFEKMCADMKWALAKLAANADLKSSKQSRAKPANQKDSKRGNA